VLQWAAVCCSALQRVAVCCSVLQCIVLDTEDVFNIQKKDLMNDMQDGCVAVSCSVLQCLAVCCGVLQCVAACCSVLQCIVLDTEDVFNTQKKT